jgi:hypothetical protein
MINIKAGDGRFQRRVNVVSLDIICAWALAHSFNIGKIDRLPNHLFLGDAARFALE